MATLKIIDLYNLCEKEILKGNKNKTILVSADEDGNYFNTLTDGFIDGEQKDSFIEFSYNIIEDTENYILLI